uniref:Uncharacterized protein LOC100373234 n=1 Tax=Saccoglossus kowalevskii TaxID=10224 RepID=A0ABM0MRD4_SACKO|nr:PREDICTED: uncharacterized protein LOC100373234 [Saccoglossus kowalevskii]
MGVADWPAGIYALPKPKRGCPGASSVWQETSIFVNLSTTNILQPTLWNNSHLSGQSTNDTFNIDICTRTQGSDADDGETTNNAWPAGKYCTYSMLSPSVAVNFAPITNSTSSPYNHGVLNASYNCPRGFTEGSLIWPFPTWSKEGVSSPYVSPSPNSTQSYYCCQATGDTEKPIQLPTEKPFLLFPFGNKCQQVKDMSVSLEKIEWNFNRRFYSGPQTRETLPFTEEGSNNRTQFYCYYSREENKAKPISKYGSHYRILDSNSTDTKDDSSILMGVPPDYPPPPDYTYIKIIVAVVIVGTPGTTLLVLCILRTRNIHMRKNFRKRESYRMASFTYQSSLSMRRYSNSPPSSDDHKSEKPLKGHSFKFHNNRLSANSNKKRYDI